MKSEAEKRIEELRGWADCDSPDEEYPDVDRDIDIYVNDLLSEYDRLREERDDLWKYATDPAAGGTGENKKPAKGK